MNKMFVCINVSLLVFVAVWTIPVQAQSSGSESVSSAAEESDKSRGSGLGGPSSVPGTLGKDLETRPTAWEEFLAEYFGFKKRVEEAIGLSFGFDYYALIQAASQSPGEDSAISGVFRTYGHWKLVGRNTENTGSLVFKVENRHRLGSDIAPKDLGFETGYAGLTAVTFSDIDWALTNFYWSQILFNNRLAFVVGDVDVTDYTDVYGLVNIWTEFSNYAFATNPTIPAPDQGFGAAVRVMATEKVYIVGGIADANGDPTDPGNIFDSFFNDAEFFTHVEVGWISSWERRFNDNIHLTAWHVDERENKQVSDGWGVAFSFSHLYADTWEPFFRAGYAEDGGALWERSISAGLGYHTRNKSDVLGMGLNWSKPSETTVGPGLDDQFTAEIYYKFKLLKVFNIIPDVQLLFNPALNQDEDLIAIFGLRGRISF